MRWMNVLVAVGGHCVNDGKREVGGSREMSKPSSERLQVLTVPRARLVLCDPFFQDSLIDRAITNTIYHGIGM